VDESWLRDPDTRGSAERQLKVALVLGAVAARDGAQPRPEDLEALRQSLMGATPMSWEDWKKMLASDRALAQRVHNFLLHQATLDHVMALVTVE
jgi:FKBP-type peptidyl-prolyl cis-trans isomerase (trigger factor)